MLHLFIGSTTDEAYRVAVWSLEDTYTNNVVNTTFVKYKYNDTSVVPRSEILRAMFGPLQHFGGSFEIFEGHILQ